jgi:hypothetical protein
MYLVGGNRSGEALELEIPDGSRFDSVFDSGEDSLPDQDLAVFGVRAEPRSEVHYWPKRGVVIAALKADPADRRVSGLDPNGEPDFNATLSPFLRQLREPLLGIERKPYRLELMIGDSHGIIEEDP